MLLRERDEYRRAVDMLRRDNAALRREKEEWIESSKLACDVAEVFGNACITVNRAIKHPDLPDSARLRVIDFAMKQAYDQLKPASEALGVEHP